jgi:hypothetical protein
MLIQSHASPAGYAVSNPNQLNLIREWLSLRWVGAYSLGQLALVAQFDDASDMP